MAGWAGRPERRVATSKIEFSDSRSNQSSPFELREPTKLSLRRYLDYNPACKEVADLNWIINFINCYHSRFLCLNYLKFETHQSFVVESREGRTQITRLSEVEGVQDLLEQYASGSLYMSETLGGQSKLFEPSVSGARQ